MYLRNFPMILHLQRDCEPSSTHRHGIRADSLLVTSYSSKTLPAVNLSTSRTPKTTSIALFRTCRLRAISQRTSSASDSLCSVTTHLKMTLLSQKTLARLPPTSPNSKLLLVTFKLPEVGMDQKLNAMHLRICSPPHGTTTQTRLYTWSPTHLLMGSKSLVMDCRMDALLVSASASFSYLSRSDCSHTEHPNDPVSIAKKLAKKGIIVVSVLTYNGQLDLNIVECSRMRANLEHLLSGNSSANVSRRR
jgi:hypothetical protein